MEILQVIGRVAVGAFRHLRADFRAIAGEAPAVHFRCIAQEGLRGFERLGQVRGAQVLRRRIKPGFDIGAVLHEEAQVGLAQFRQVRPAARRAEFGLAGTVKPTGLASGRLHLCGVPGSADALPGGVACPAGSFGGAVQKSHEGNM